jgi:hypothetical protein
VANSYVSFSTTSADGLKEYTFPFNFLRPEHIKVVSVRSAVYPVLNAQTINWTYIPETTWNSNLVNGETSYPFGNYSVVFENGVNKIKFPPAEPSGTITTTFTITIYRRTTAIVNNYFSNGSPIQASDLNAVLLQSLYNSEEALDAIDSVNAVNLASSLAQKFDKSGGLLTGGIQFNPFSAITGVTSLTTSSSGSGVTTSQVSLLGGTIRNVPTPAYDTDVANKAYVDSLTLSGGSQPVISNDSITSEFLRKVVGEEAVTTTAIRSQAVTDVKLATNAVTTAKIATGAVSGVKILTGAVTAEKIDANAVTSVAINNGAVTADKIATGAVTTAKLASSSVTNDKILDGTITSAKFAGGTLYGGSVLDNNSVPYTKLQDFSGSWSPTLLNLNQTGINFTGTYINALTATMTAQGVIEKTPLNYYATEQLNAGRLVLKTGGIKPNFGVSQGTISSLDGTIPTLEIDSTADGNGYYSYNIVAKNPALLGKQGGITLMKWQDRYAGSYPQYGSGQLGYVYPTFFYKTISNIPFNYVIENENPEISLTGTTEVPLTTSGNIVFNNLGQVAKKYLITLVGSAQCIRSTGLLYLKPISDSYYEPQTSQISVPKSVARVAFDATQYRVFNISTILNVPNNTSLSFPVQYYYTDNNNSTPTANTVCGFGRGADYLISSATPYPGPPVEWRGDTLNRWNESIVDLIIQRLK